MSFTDCLRKLGLDKYEADLLKADARDLTLDGMDGRAAAMQAIKDRISEYQQERENILGQVREQGGLERRSAPQEGPRDRRSKAREAYQKLSQEDLIDKVISHELTGIKGRNAFNIDRHAKIFASIDADSLKWINDNLSHDHGDALLQAVADALDAQTDMAYHVSGDEFYVLGDTAEEVQGAVDAAIEVLKKAEIVAIKPDGTEIVLNGLNLTYGIGETKNAADQILGTEKEARERRGERAPRRHLAQLFELPKGSKVVVRLPE
jgi:diguanylate cyclase (GGDEF)-like protein